jgi:5-methylcytosine-specific restriction endonuclease McrA
VRIRPAKTDRKPWHTDEYVAYLRSEAWARIRREVLERAGHRCECWLDGQRRACGETSGLEVHHKHYRVFFGREAPGDLQVLCPRHHRIADTGRRESARRTTLRRKYGDWRPR